MAKKGKGKKTSAGGRGKAAKAQAGSKAKAGAGSSGKGKKGRKKSVLASYKREIYAVVALAIVLFVAYSLMQPQEATVGDLQGQDQELEVLKMIIVKSNNCPKCEENNSLEAMFRENLIPYGVGVVEESSAEGSKIVRELGLEKLPAFIIDSRNMKDEWVVNTKSGVAKLRDVLLFYVQTGNARFEEEVFVFYELSLDLQPHINLLLGEGCHSDGNVVVHHFADPYDLSAISTSADMEVLRELFEPYNVEVRYQYLPTAASKPMLEVANQETIDTAAKHLMCASKQGVAAFNALEKSIYTTYCDLERDVNSHHDRLFNCNEGTRYGIPVRGDEVMESVEAAGLAGNQEYIDCLADYEEMFNEALALGNQWKIAKVPTVVVNCTYEVHPRDAHQVVCSYLGDVLICRKARD